MHSHLKADKGSALIAVLLIIMVLFIFGISILSTAVTDIKISSYQENSMKAYQLAYSGAKALADYIINTPKVNISSMVKADKSAPVQIGDGSFVLDVTKSDNELIINSTGIVNGVNKTASVVLESSAAQSLFDYTIFSVGNITIKNDVEIRGDISTNASESSNPISKGNKSVITGETEYDSGITIPTIIAPSKFEFNKVYPYRIQTGLTIDMQEDEEYYLFEKGIDIKKGIIKVSSSDDKKKIIHLYIEKGGLSLDNSNHSSIEVDDNITAIIYVLDGDVNIKSRFVEAAIYAPYSKVEVECSGGGSGRSMCSIIAKEVFIHNKTVVDNNLIYVSDRLTIEDSYKIKEWR